MLSHDHYESLGLRLAATALESTTGGDYGVRRIVAYSTHEGKKYWLVEWQPSWKTFDWLRYVVSSLITMQTVILTPPL